MNWPPEPPENYDITPCDDCEFFGGKRYKYPPHKAPEEFECDEDEPNIDECPYWNPEPVYCVVCNRQLIEEEEARMVCTKCQYEEDKRRFEAGEFDDDWKYLARFSTDEEEE